MEIIELNREEVSTVSGGYIWGFVSPVVAILSVFVWSREGENIDAAVGFVAKYVVVQSMIFKPKNYRALTK